MPCAVPIYNFKCHQLDSSDHCSVNIGAILEQIATGREANHLTVQLTCVQVPSLKLAVEAPFKWNVAWVQQLKPWLVRLIANPKEKQLAIEQKNCYSDSGSRCRLE